MSICAALPCPAGLGVPARPLEQKSGSLGGSDGGREREVRPSAWSCSSEGPLPGLQAAASLLYPLAVGGGTPVIPEDGEAELGTEGQRWPVSPLPESPASGDCAEGTLARASWPSARSFYFKAFFGSYYPSFYSHWLHLLGADCIQKGNRM